MISRKINMYKITYNDMNMPCILGQGNTYRFLLTLFKKYSVHYSQRNSMINHYICKNTTFLGDTDISFGQFNLFTMYLLSCAFWAIAINALNTKEDILNRKKDISLSLRWVIRLSQ